MSTRIRMLLHAADIHARIGSAWPAVLEQLGIPVEALRLKKSGPCPACGGEDRYTFDNRKGRGDFICRHCGAGDGFALLERVHGWTFTEARRRIMEVAGLASQSEYASSPNIQPVNISRDRRQDWSDRAQQIWRRTLPLAELARNYLTGRGCLVPPADGDLRYLPPSDRHPPTLCARITDALTGRPISLHFTQLLPDGSGRGERRMLAGHRKRGGVVRLWPDETIGFGLAVAEGLETALAAARIYLPIWSCIDAGNMATLPVLPGVEALTLYADHDEVGTRAAKACATIWLAAGRDVEIYRPRQVGDDFADLMVKRDARGRAT